MKRSIATLLLLLASITLAHAQVVTTEPKIPRADQSVTIYFDATKGTGGLEDYNGDVYAHTGLITEASDNDSDWQHVLTPWPDGSNESAANTDKNRMQQVDGKPNMYKLEITPTIREFYGASQSETIKKMAFVFRNSDGSKEAKATGGDDIFVQVYQNQFNVKLLQPSDSIGFYPHNSSVTIKGIASSSQNSSITLSLSIDGQQVRQVNDDTLEYTYNGQTAGNHDITLSGSDGNQNSDQTTKQLVINPAINEQARPSGLQDGITYVDDNTVQLSLFAPQKDFVYVIGGFNNWQPQPEYFMNRETVNADSTYYWIEFDVPNGDQEYGFQYLVDGDIRVADPYTEKALNEYDDPNIDQSTYPDLKPYPSGKTGHLVSILYPRHQDYNWQHLNYDRPDKQNLMIYELLVRDFVKKHDYETLTDTLDYLDRLGINAIELMPVMEFEGNSSWGYNPALLFAPDKYYGPAEDLKKFIDEAHSRNMAVILDVVLNHVYGQSPLVRLWNQGTYGQPTAQNPYLNQQSPNQTFSFGYDFNHESAATQYYVDRVTRYWLQEYHADGYRFDFTKGFTQNPGDGGAYDGDRIRILERMADQQWAVDDSSYVILEHFAANSEEKELSSHGMMIWGNMNSSYNEATMGYHDNGKSDFSGVYYGNRAWDDPHLVGYMESHDEERLMYKNLQFGNSDGSYDITDLGTALNRVKMAGAFFFTVPGPKMVWQFGELGYDISIETNGRTGEKPIKWEYYSDTKRKKLYDTFKALIRLRKSHPAFTSAESKVELDVRDAAKRITIDHPELKVSIVGNFGVQEMDERPNFATSGTWYEYFSGDTLSVSDTDTSMTLQPGEFHIYTTKKFEAPEGDLISSGNAGSGDGGDEMPQTLEVHQNYPNPFNPSTTIPYDLPEEADVTLQVFNILGQEVMTQDLGHQSAGQNKEIRVNFSGLSSGIYIYRLKAGAQVDTRKMMLIK